MLAHRSRDLTPEEQDEVVAAFGDREEIEKAVEGLRIIVKDPRKEQRDLEEELA